MALSFASPPRRGSVEISRVVARRRWLQNAQCWVRIWRRGGEDVILLDSGFRQRRLGLNLDMYANVCRGMQACFFLIWVVVVVAEAGWEF